MFNLPFHGKIVLEDPDLINHNKSTNSQVKSKYIVTYWAVMADIKDSIFTLDKMIVASAFALQVR